MNSISKKALRAHSLIFLLHLTIDVWPVVNEISHVNGDIARFVRSGSASWWPLWYFQTLATLSRMILLIFTQRTSVYCGFSSCVFCICCSRDSMSQMTRKLCVVFFFFSHRQAFYRTSLYIRIPPPPPPHPPDFWCSPCCSSLYFSVFFVIVLCLVRPMLTVSLYYQFLIAFSLSVSFFLPWVFLLFYQVYICSFLNAPNLLMSDILNVSSITTKYITVRCGAIRRMHFLTRNIKVRMTGRGPRNEYGTKEPFPEMF